MGSNIINTWYGYDQAIERDSDFGKIRNNWQVNWNAYRGIFPNRLRLNRAQETGQVNFLKLVTKTINWFIFGLKGVDVKLLNESNDRDALKDIQSKLDKVLEANNFKEFCKESINSMLIFGDAFAQVGWEESDPSNEFIRRKYNLDTNGVCKFKNLDNFIVYPVVREDDITTVDYYIVTNLTDSLHSDNAYIEIYKPDRVEVYRDSRPVKPLFVVENPIVGELPITHLANERNPQSFYGISEFEDLFPINQEYVVKNDVFSETVDRISLAPLVVKGAKAKKRIRLGVNEVLDGLRPEASIEYLELKGKLEPLQNFLENLEGKFYTIAGIPKIARGEQISVSNTSSAAMKVMYYPLMLRAGLKRPAIDEFLTDIIWKILIFMEAKGEIDIPKDLKIMLTYPNPFPKDVNSIIQEIQVRKDLNAITKRQLLELLEVNQEDMEEVLTQLGTEIAPEAVITSINNYSSNSELSQEMKEGNIPQTQNKKEGSVV